MLGLADLDGGHSLHRIPPVAEPSSAGRQAVNDALKLLKTWEGLSEQEQIVVKGYLDGNSFEAISKQFGVSRQRVQQVYAKALDKLDLTEQQRRDLSAAHRVRMSIAQRGACLGLQHSGAGRLIHQKPGLRFQPPIRGGKCRPKRGPACRSPNAAERTARCRPSIAPA